MGLLHTWEIQCKPHPHTHFSLLPHLFVTFSFAILSWWTEEVVVTEWLSCWCCQLQHQWCFEQTAKQTKKSNHHSSQKETILVLPYLGVQSKIVTKQLKTCINKFHGCIDLKVIFVSARRIKSFFPYKDIINRSQMSKNVYKASCWDCQDF